MKPIFTSASTLGVALTLAALACTATDAVAGSRDRERMGMLNAVIGGLLGPALDDEPLPPRRRALYEDSEPEPAKVQKSSTSTKKAVAKTKTASASTAKKSKSGKAHASGTATVAASAAAPATAPFSAGVTPYVIAISKTGNAYFFVWNGSSWIPAGAPDNCPIIHPKDWTNPEGVPQTPYTAAEAFTPFALPYAVLYDYSERDSSDFGTPEAGWNPAPRQMEGNGYIVTGDGIIVGI